MKIKAHFKRNWGKYLCGYLAMAIFAAPFAPQESTQQAVPEKVTKPDPVEEFEKPVEAVVETPTLADVVVEYVGESLLISQGIEDGYYVVHRKFGAWGAQWIAEIGTLELTEIIYAHEDYEALGVMVKYYGESTDLYGNSTSKMVHMAGLINETIEKINFDRVDASNLPKLADEYERFAPAFK